MSNIEAGTHRARVLDAALGTTNSGKEQVAVSFELIDLEGAPRIPWYGYFSDAALPHTLKQLRVCGWTGDDLSDFSMVGGAEVMLTIAMDEYNGKVRPKVAWVNPMGGGAALKNQMEPHEAKSFAARMKSRVAAFDRQEAAPKVSGSPLAAAKKRSGVLSPEPPPHTDAPDDIPF